MTADHDNPAPPDAMPPNAGPPDPAVATSATAPDATTPNAVTPDTAAQKMWQQAWDLFDRDQPQAAAALFRHLHEQGETGAAGALGHALHRAGAWDDAADAFRAAIAAEDDDAARLALLETRFARVAALDLPPDHADIAEAFALAERTHGYHPHASVMAGSFCLYLAQQTQAQATAHPDHQPQHRHHHQPQHWTRRAHAYYEAAHRAGLLAGTARLARLKWRQHDYVGSIALRLRGLRTLFIAWKNGPDDPRLYGLHDLPPGGDRKRG